MAFRRMGRRGARWCGAPPVRVSLSLGCRFTGGLEAYHPVIFGMGVGGIYGSPKAAVLAGKIFLGDPTGPTAESSNRDPNLLGNQKVHQLLQRWNADAMDLLRDVVLDQGRSLSHEDNARLMAGIYGSLGHEKGEGCRRGVIGAVGTNVKYSCHKIPP
jgi:hypothetical protein